MAITGEALEADLGEGKIIIIPTDESPVASVNGKIGNVVLDAADVGALPDDTEIPQKTSDLQNDCGYITATGRRNLVNTLNPLGTPYYRSNASRDGNKLRLHYRDQSRNTYFYIFLSRPLEAGKTYTLSFDCSGIATGQTVKFRVSKRGENNTVYDEGTAVSDPFTLKNGRNAVTFTPQTSFSEMVRLDDVLGSGESRPNGANIVLEDFQIEEGSVATPWMPSLDAMHREAERIEKVTRTETEKESWQTALIDEDFAIASIVRDGELLQFSLDSDSGLYASSYRYKPLPFPMFGSPIVGSCDKLGAFIGNRGGSTATHDGKTVTVGVYYKIFAPGLAAQGNHTIYTALQIAARVATPPKNPGSAFATPNQEIGAAIVAVAESYVTAMNPPDHATAAGVNQKYSYGKNFFYQECDIVNIVENSAHLARMECDTFVGLVLRGIDYDHSPFKSGNYALESKTEDGESFDVVDRTEEGMSSGTYLYDKVMSDTASVVSSVLWATALRAKLSESSGVVRYFKHDARTAAELAWMFWKISGCLFTDPSKAAPGDVAFFRDPQNSTWFDGITHTAIVGNSDADGMTIYEVTGYDAESGGRVLQHVSLSKRSSKPAYFARPYGWS